MADTRNFFQNLPLTLAESPAIARNINDTYQFDIEGAGTWSVDLTGGGVGRVIEGAIDKPGCLVTASKADFEALLDNPGVTMLLVMQKKIKVSNMRLALSLQKLLS